MLALALFCSTLAVAPPAMAAPSVDAAFPGFSVSQVFGGLTNPVATRFAADGRAFVAEKSGKVKVFDSTADPTPTLVIDLGANVHDYWDRGLLGLAVHPQFPAQNWIYAFYSFDQGDSWGDDCPNPPGATDDGCVINSRLSRFQVGIDNLLIGSEQVLLEGHWCQQYPSHSVGDLAFGTDGALYVSAGDGASFNVADYGQGGGDPGSPTPANPCGDPPSGVGGTQTPPTAEGGALRSQDLLSSGDALGYDGTILRLDPATGTALPDNPLFGGSIGADDRVIAHGFRNPFRFTIRPGTSELWVGEVGWFDWEEVDVIVDPIDAVVENFGWPCHEGNGRQASYDALNLNLCEGVYGASTISPLRTPYYTYPHFQPPTACPEGGSAISAIGFYGTGDYPTPYHGALFFADYAYGCIRVMLTGADGLPDPRSVETIVTCARAVDIQRAPDGYIYFTDIGFPFGEGPCAGPTDGAVYRLDYSTTLAAIARANPTTGTIPLVVQFDGSQSTDPQGEPLAYAWDLDGDGLFDDSPAVAPTWTYLTPGSVTVRLRVTDPGGASDEDQAIVVPTTNQAPTATITNPPMSTIWQAGQLITFSGSANDPEDGPLPDTAYSWRVVLQHCAAPTSCHPHLIQTFAGITGGSFFAPAHDPPAHLTIELAVVDSGGLTDLANLNMFPAPPPPPPPAPGPPPSPLPTFTDVPPDHMFFTAVEWLAAEEITGGCSSTTFCPDDPITREQMAAFLVRALGLSGGAGADYFTDDDSSSFEDDIDRLRHAGITAGCNPPAGDHFCPGNDVTREQMAAFLVRALGLTAGIGADYFADDDGLSLEDEIDRLRTAGITAGCNPAGDHFCPFQHVTRGQMAAFLYRALAGQA